MGIKSNATVLFQGDSITDAGRTYKNGASLGIGYAMMTAAWFSARYSETCVKFLNRGISGNRIIDLRNRWQKDCLDLKPDVVSILIGINDSLSKYCWTSPTPIESFEDNYREILERTHDVIDAKLVLMEPFILNVTKNQLSLREDLNQKIEAVRKLSREFKAVLVPLDRIFEEAAKKREPSFWLQDGIHPTLAGHALIAQSWLEITANSPSDI